MTDTSKTLEVLQALQDLTDKLTWRRILTAFMAGVVALALCTGFEHRTRLADVVVGWLSGTPEHFVDWDVSVSSGQRLQTLVESNSLMSMILVEKIDLQRNRRIPKFWFLNSHQNEFTKLLAGRLADAAFDDDAQSVKQLIGVLNNEFVCSKIEDTALFHYFPQLKASTPYVCFIAVPPFYGRMLGILTFGLSAKPTPTEHAAIRAEATHLAIEIYLHDIAKQGG